MNLWGRQWTRAELLAHTGRLEQVAGVQLAEAADGAERGVRLLRFATGTGFDFEVLVDRGFDIGRAWLAGRPLAWWSPVGLISPWLHDASGIEWFRGFSGGLVSTCGLDHTLLAQLGSGTYVAAMEPSTNRDAGRLDARARGELQVLRPGESRRYELEIGALDGQRAIGDFADGLPALLPVEPVR